jgi:hypothetical protein
VAQYTRAIEVAARQVGPPVVVKTLRNGMATALETDPARARQVRQTTLTQPPSL